MKPFNLQAAIDGEPIVCRDGTRAEFIAHIPEADDSYERVVFFCDGSVWLCDESGRTVRDIDGECSTDLFMKSAKLVVWVNIYERTANKHFSECEANEYHNKTSWGSRLGNQAHRIEIDV